MFHMNLRYSKNGYTNSDWRIGDIGEIGDFNKPVILRRFGSSREFVFQERVTDDCHADLIACSVQTEAGGA